MKYIFVDLGILLGFVNLIAEGLRRPPQAGKDSGEASPNGMRPEVQATTAWLEH